MHRLDVILTAVVANRHVLGKARAQTLVRPFSYTASQTQAKGSGIARIGHPLKEVVVPVTVCVFWFYWQDSCCEFWPDDGRKKTLFLPEADRKGRHVR